MTTNQQNINFERIRKAIEYIDVNHKKRPSLDEVAAHIHLSPFHFQRLFTEFAGVSPKQFLQFISIQNAKKLLKEDNLTLFDTSNKLGFSSTSRLHDLFISTEAMTPADYKNGAQTLKINYSIAGSPFGKVLIASTSKGVCFLAFTDNEEVDMEDMRSRFPNADFEMKSDEFQQNALSVFKPDSKNIKNIKLHLRGTDFQLKVWEALLRIPLGKLTTYGNIAQYLENPKASRAVGSAVGSNPVSFLVPCHRVIQSTGFFGGYYWGPSRKKVIIGWESAVSNEEQQTILDL